MGRAVVLALASLSVAACTLITPLDGLSGGTVADAGEEDVDAADAEGGPRVTEFRIGQIAPVAAEGPPVIDGTSLPAFLFTNATLVARTEPAVIGSVRFEVDGQRVNVDSVTPYTLTAGAPPVPWNPSAGAHTITATPFTLPELAGKAGASLSVHVTIGP